LTLVDAFMRFLLHAEHDLHTEHGPSAENVILDPLLRLALPLGMAFLHADLPHSDIAYVMQIFQKRHAMQSEDHLKNNAGRHVRNKSGPRMEHVRLLLSTFSYSWCTPSLLFSSPVSHVVLYGTSYFDPVLGRHISYSPSDLSHWMNVPSLACHIYHTTAPHHHPSWHHYWRNVFSDPQAGIWIPRDERPSGDEKHDHFEGCPVDGLSCTAIAASQAIMMDLCTSRTMMASRFK
jgi:hypothetical protein